MQVPLEWLKQYVEVDADAEAVATRLTMGGLEVEGIEESAGGPALDVYITPNRGDCLSIVGVAREVAALYDAPLTTPAPPKSERGGDVDALATVTIEDSDLCPRYTARIVRGVKIGSSPAWMQARLEAAGQRAVNNVVDVTNYVMLELGQPLHAFDLNKLAGRQIIVRRAREGEMLTTLDGQERALNAAMLVIADADKVVAVAGVMGGADTEVSATTTNLLLEAAHFDPLVVRRTSRALGLRTEASYRFERVVDPSGTRRAVDRACELLAAMGQAQAVAGVIDVAPNPIVGRDIVLRASRAAALLGMSDLTPDIARDCLTRLGIQVAADGDVLTAHVPPSRPDLRLEEDLIEEVGRIYGYENIPETLPAGSATQGGDSAEGRFIARVKDRLTACGLQEVVTHSLTAPSFFDSPNDAARRVPVRNALSSEISGLRHSLTPTLLDVAQHNSAQGQHSLALFEVGRVWHNRHENPDHEGEMTAHERIHVAGLLVGPLGAAGWQRAARPEAADLALARGVVAHLFAGLGIANATFTPLDAATDYLPQYHPGRTALISFGERPEGVVGEVHPRVAQKLELRGRAYVFELSLAALQQAAPPDGPRYQPLPSLPAASRDLAPRVPLDLPYSAVEAALYGAAVPLLESFRLTDVFQGQPLPPDVKSLTLALLFRAPDHTLTESEIAESLTRLRVALETKCGATFAGG